MVLTAQSKPAARDKIPAVIHADGTGRIQIVNPEDDPLTYAYLKALGRHIGVEISVNTSFNVAGPIAQTPQQAIDTLRRSKGLDAVVLVADDGAVYAAWHGGERDSGRFTGWFAEWKECEAAKRHVMKKPTRRTARLPTAAASNKASTMPKLETASMSDIIDALASGRVTATELTKCYLARIEAYDRGGPMLNSVREINPDALTIAGKLDNTKPSVKRPLAGVPILVKDNIATGDKQSTTAGSLALEGARAKGDATVVKLLRDAGAVILGKANLTEFANMLAVDMPSGYSSLGGQVKNPYAPTLMDDRGIPVVLPGGSSSGSAVAVAAGLCAASIGSETSGSLLFPASQNGLVTVKPTVGLISRAGILPISHSQDTAGPMTRTVRDAALLLNVLAAKDPLDPATQRQRRPRDYTADLDDDAIKGARIGVPSDPTDPVNDCYYGKLPPKWAKVMAEAIKVLEDLGAVIVRASMPTAGWIGGPGTTMAVLNRNPLSRNKGNPATPPIVFLYELKRDLNLYLRDWAANTGIKNMADIVASTRRTPEGAAFWPGPVPSR